MTKRITAKLEEPDRCLALEWDEGDFGIIDNLAVAHYAAPATQTSAEKAGLRILHRTTVAGDNVPTKSV